MSVGLTESEINRIAVKMLSEPVDAQSIAKAIAVAIRKNNREIEKQLRNLDVKIDSIPR